MVRVWLEGEDPRMEEMLEWAQRACFRIAEVTVMHSVTTSDTGSMATGMDAIPGPRGGEMWMWMFLYGHGYFSAG